MRKIFKRRFSSIPNITGDYIATGEMAARFFLQRGFKHFAFLGYKNIVWSDERFYGYRHELAKQGLKKRHLYIRQSEARIVFGLTTYNSSLPG